MCSVCVVFFFLCLVLSCLVAGFCLFVRTQGVGVSHSLLPASLFEHMSMGQARNPPTLGTTLCVSRALMPTLAVQPPHVCHRQRDWAVSIGSHMQQDMDISKAPPHLGAPLPLFFFCVHVWEPRSKKLAIVSPGTWWSFVLSFVMVTTRVFRPNGRILHIKHDQGNTIVQRTTFTHVTFHDGLLFVHQCGLP